MVYTELMKITVIEDIIILEDNNPNNLDDTAIQPTLEELEPLNSPLLENYSWLELFIIKIIAITLYDITQYLTNSFIDFLKILTLKETVNLPMSEPAHVPMPTKIFNDIVPLLDKNTIYGPAIDGIQIYSNEEIFNIMSTLIALLNKELNLMPLNGEMLRCEVVLHNILVNCPFYDNLFNNSPEALLNVNNLINLLIQDAMIQWALTGDLLYYKIAMGIMIEQLAFIAENEVSYYYNDASIYYNLERHFIDRFKL